MSDVFYFDFSTGKDVLAGLRNLVQKGGLFNNIREGASVAVKLHMGELGNITYIRPVLARRVVDLVRAQGTRPFVTDTVTLYPGSRDSRRKYLRTAAANGFVRQSMGVPVMIADADGEDGVAIKLKQTLDGCAMNEVDIARGIFEADFMVVLSHVKGHMITGFGGAIKNLAMGCVTRSAKRAQHKMNPVFLDESKCNGCGDCITACPSSAVMMADRKPQRDPDACIYCSTCLFACNSAAWFWKKENKAVFQVYLAHAASAVMQRFGEKAVFLNFLQDVTPNCDCAAPAGLPVIADVGILASIDPVALDKASLDLLDGASVVHPSVPLGCQDRLGKLHGTESLIHLRMAEALGLGSTNYRLIQV